MIDYSDVLDLIPRAHADPQESRRGATDVEIERLRAEGVVVPPELSDWLLQCSGTTAGPGGILGVGRGDGVDISFILGLHPEWRELGWVPVAGDGFGNHYVLDTTRGNAIGFVEAAIDTRTIAYYVASDLKIFLHELLLNDVEGTGWPFDRARAEAEDPKILRLHPLPWEA